jgi:hypothetical protein
LYLEDLEQYIMFPACLLIHGSCIARIGSLAVANSSSRQVFEPYMFYCSISTISSRYPLAALQG